MKRTRVRSLRPGEPHPEGTPRRYLNSAGYTRLRWKLGPAEYVETYERDESGALVRDPSKVTAKRIDGAAAEQLYAEGLSQPQIARRLGVDVSGVSRVLRRRGVTARTTSDYADPFDVAELLDLYRSGLGVAESARRAGTSYSRAAQAIRAAGLMRGKGRMPGAKPIGSYEAEFKTVRPSIVARASGRCEARTSKCTGLCEHVHHRKLRRQGGTNDPSNLLAVCTTCHRFIHNHPKWAREVGLMVPSWADPELVLVDHAKATATPPNGDPT